MTSESSVSTSDSSATCSEPVTNGPEVVEVVAVETSEAAEITADPSHSAPIIQDTEAENTSEPTTLMAGQLSAITIDSEDLATTVSRPVIAELEEDVTTFQPVITDEGVDVLKVAQESSVITTGFTALRRESISESSPTINEVNPAIDSTACVPVSLIIRAFH